MTTNCTSPECILITLLLSGLLGLIGQGIRVIVGLKKLREEAAAENAPNPKAAFDDKFDVRQLWLSLFIGFIAGCLANLGRPKGEFTPEVQLAIIAAGYAGADFIEGAFNKLLPKK
ncbi:hypothetical protein GCM10028803_30490 [Larkinella knui]|uniref:Uncharacterized protein n=1 Tax=Larkinella knui TaxID=2025310 RepID=A0A3P1CXC9_9BACT|nr:hypothetical protein [Larkinella knui]RRB18077.1 hypothetical protein EHT87_07330 [Larkinella knui]